MHIDHIGVILFEYHILLFTFVIHHEKEEDFQKTFKHASFPQPVLNNLEVIAAINVL